MSAEGEGGIRTESGSGVGVSSPTEERSTLAKMMASFWPSPQCLLALLFLKP